jgi:starch phosphorylase
MASLVSGPPPAKRPTIAYFSMEIGLEPSIPTYSGGLGVLAGDTIRSAADLRIPMVAVTLLHRRGYFSQKLDTAGHQSEEPVVWSVEKYLESLDARATIEIENRPVRLRAWRYQVTGITGHRIPVYLLDADLPENADWDRRLTDSLYGGDQYYRLCQEIILGIGGLRMLQALGHTDMSRYHMNEGHAAFLVVALLEERVAALGGGSGMVPEALKAVQERCVFTTHTPVPAGHDQFPCELARRVLGGRMSERLNICAPGDPLNMTELALHHAGFINGVAMKHSEVSRSMFPDYPIHSITNGVHAATWTAPAFQALYDRRLPDWRKDPLSLRYAIGIPDEEIWDAHQAAKRALIERVNRETGAELVPDALTIGFARRAATYKRGALVFHDLERLKSIARQAGPIQFVFAGKAHPHDDEGKEVIRRIHEIRDTLRGAIRVAYLNNYDMAVGRLVCAGADVWLNTPLPPLEASGTSGMKAAMNGVPSLSVMDGWWIEGHLEDVTGWSIGDWVESRLTPREGTDARYASALYEKLDGKILPCFYKDRPRFIDIMRSAIAINGSFFNTHRMVSQYWNDAYGMGL